MVFVATRDFLWGKRRVWQEEGFETQAKSFCDSFVEVFWTCFDFLTFEVFSDYSVAESEEL
jgi:hypothetical protein